MALRDCVGVANYTPQHEVKDASGRVIGTISGRPYPVPRVVLRGVASDLYVVFPGSGSSLDSVKFDGIVE